MSISNLFSSNDFVLHCSDINTEKINGAAISSSPITGFASLASWDALTITSGSNDITNFEVSTTHSQPSLNCTLEADGITVANGGKYKVDYHLRFKDVGNYSPQLEINGSAGPKEQSFNSGEKEVGKSCIMHLPAGAKLSLRVSSSVNTETQIQGGAYLNIVRIGD